MYVEEGVLFEYKIEFDKLRGHETARTSDRPFCRLLGSGIMSDSNVSFLLENL